MPPYMSAMEKKRQAQYEAQLRAQANAWSGYSADQLQAIFGGRGGGQGGGYYQQQSPFTQQADAYNDYMQNYNSGMNGLMGNYTSQYDAETRRQQAIDNYYLQWNTGEVNKNLGFGRLANERELGLDENNVQRYIADKNLTGRTRETEAERAWREYESANATERARIGIQPEMLAQNNLQSRFTSLLPNMQDFMGSYSEMLRGGIGGGGGGSDLYGNGLRDAAGDYGIATNGQVVPTPGAAQQAQFYNPTAGQTGPQSGLPAPTPAPAPAQGGAGGYVDPYANAKPGQVGDPASGRWVDAGSGMQNWEWTDGKIHTSQLIARRTPPPGYVAPQAQNQAPALRAPWEPAPRTTGAAAPAAQQGDPRLAQLAEIQKRQEAYIAQQGASGNPAAMQGRGGIAPNQRMTQDQIDAYNRQGHPDIPVQDATFMNAPYAQPDFATMAKAALPQTAPAPTAQTGGTLASPQSAPQGMVQRDQNGMPVRQNMNPTWGGGPTGGPVLLDDNAARAWNAAPEISTAPTFGGADQRALLGQMESYNMNEARNSIDQMMKNRSAGGGMNVSNPQWAGTMGRLAKNQAGINTNTQRTNMIGQFAQTNAQQTLAAQQARNTQYQQGLNYSLQNRQLGLQKRAQNQNFALGSFNAKVGAAQPMFSMMNKYT